MHFLRDLSNFLTQRRQQFSVIMFVQAVPAQYHLCDNVTLFSSMYLFKIFMFYLNIASPITRKILWFLLLMTKQTRKFPFKTENQNPVSSASL